MVKHSAFTKIISVTVGPNDPGGEKHFRVAEFSVLEFNDILQTGRAGESPCNPVRTFPRNQCSQTTVWIGRESNPSEMKFVKAQCFNHRA